MSQFISMTSTNADIVILGGDLNTEPGDLGYRIICHNAQLQDSFLQAQQVCLISIIKMRIAHLMICIYKRVHRIVKSHYQLHHVCLSVCMEQLSSHYTDFHEIWYLSIFWKSVIKIQVLLKSDKNNRYFTWRLTNIYDISHIIKEWIWNIHRMLINKGKLKYLQ